MSFSVSVMKKITNLQLIDTFRGYYAARKPLYSLFFLKFLIMLQLNQMKKMV